MNIEARISHPKRTHYGWIILCLIILTVFCALGLARFGYTAILPAMQDSLRLSNTQTGELQSWNLGGYLITVVFAGVCASRFGPRAVIAVSLLITGTGMILTGLIPSFNGARIGRLLAGIGGAGSNVPAMGLVSSWFGKKRRGLATGVAAAGSSLGLLFTGPMIPWIIQQYGNEGWRNCWYLLGTLSLIICVVCAMGLRNHPEEKNLSPIGDSSAIDSPADATKKASALDWALVYKSRHLWHLATIYFAFGFSYIIYSTFFIRYLVNEGGFTFAGAGRLWLVIGIISGSSGIIWGGLSDHWGRKKSLLSVFFLQGSAFFILGLTLKTHVIFLSAGLFAITAWSIPALMAALSGDLFGPRLAPAALGLMTMIFGIGQALAPYLAGRVADATDSFACAYLVAGITAIILGAGGTYLLPAWTSNKSAQAKA